MSRQLPQWVHQFTAPNPGPMTLEGTNTWILGNSKVVIVDPGPNVESHLLDIALHAEIEHIVLTHGHNDHSEGVERLHEITGAPVSAWDQAFVHHGEKFVDNWKVSFSQCELEVIHTPGHSPDSVSFIARASGEAVLLTGDTMLGAGSAVIAHPQGHVGDYLNSLNRLALIEELLVLPGHGPVGGTSTSKAREYLVHRQDRIAQVQRAVLGGATTAEQIALVVYPDVIDELKAAALDSAQAHLMYVQERGSS